jgi:hypothetical protein
MDNLKPHTRPWVMGSIMACNASFSLANSDLTSGRATLLCRALKIGACKWAGKLYYVQD